MTEEANFYRPTAKDFQQIRQEIDKGIDWALKRGRLDLKLILLCNDFACIHIIQGPSGHSSHFVEITPSGRITVQELTLPDKPQGANDSNRPWEMIIEKPVVSLDAIARNLPAFIFNHYPVISDLPLGIYRRAKDYQYGRPMVTLDPRTSTLTFYQSAA